MNKTKKINLIFAIVAAMAMLCAFIACDMKEGYYVDEPWSYGLANSYYKPFLQDFEGYMENWHDGQYFMDYVECSPEHTFQYDSVFYNQSNDVHPPMWYSLLHTVCSFFPGTFSKWYGLGINLVLYLITLNILFLLSKEIFKNTYVSLVPVIIYAFNAGTLSMVVYLRMYTLAVMWTTLFIYLTVRMVNRSEQEGYEEKKLKWYSYIPYTLTVMCGILSHYFFVAMCGLIGFIVFIYLLVKKRRITCLAYTGACVLGGGIGFTIFPSMWSHFMDTNVSWEVITNLLHLNMSWIVDRLTSFYEYIAKEWTGSALLLSVILLICLVLLIIHLTDKERRQRSFILYMMIIAEVVYFIIIAEIAIDLTDRYHFFTYPMAGIIITWLVYDLVKVNKKEMVVALAGVGFAIALAKLGQVNYIYPGYAEALEEMGTTYKEVPAFYVCKGDHVIINDCLFTGKQDAVYPIYYENIDNIPQVLEEAGYDTSKGLVVYAEIYWNEEETAEHIAELTGLSVDHKIYDNTYTQIYYLK